MSFRIKGYLKLLLLLLRILRIPSIFIVEYIGSNKDNENLLLVEYYEYYTMRSDIIFQFYCLRPQELRPRFKSSSLQVSTLSYMTVILRRISIRYKKGSIYLFSIRSYH